MLPHRTANHRNTFLGMPSTVENHLTRRLQVLSRLNSSPYLETDTSIMHILCTPGSVSWMNTFCTYTAVSFLHETETGRLIEFPGYRLPQLCLSQRLRRILQRCGTKVLPGLHPEQSGHMLCAVFCFTPSLSTWASRHFSATILFEQLPLTVAGRR